MAVCPIENSIITIPREECIGNSLSRINNNFLDLRIQTCSNYVKLEEIDSSILALQTLVNTISSITLPGTAKAWVKFDGTRDLLTSQQSTLSTDRFLYSSYNIESVYRKTAGDYRIYFETPFSNTNYTLIGTSSETISELGNYTWLQPYRYATSYTDVRVHSNNIGDTIDPRHVSLAFF